MTNPTGTLVTVGHFVSFFETILCTPSSHLQHFSHSAALELARDFFPISKSIPEK